MVLMIDNYDSFTYNLVQYLGELGEDVRVVRNDELSVAEIKKLAPAFAWEYAFSLRAVTWNGANRLI